MSNEQTAKRAAEEIRAYWTPERMAAAKPKDFTPATTPKPDAESVPSTGEQKDIAGYDPTQSAEGSEIGLPLVGAPVPDPTQYPWRTAGKLYFTAGGQNFLGSASAIHRNTLLTAAHNLYDKGVWSENFLFIPALTGNTEPFGRWTYYRQFVISAWISSGENEANDVGVLWLNVGGNTNQPIGEVVGYLGQTYNRTLPRDWVDVGYPGSERTMYSDQGSYTRSFDSGGTVGKTGTLGSGVSGGPWLSYGDLSLINGIHSFSKSNTEKCSPYFRDSIAEFINNHLV